MVALVSEIRVTNLLCWQLIWESQSMDALSNLLLAFLSLLRHFKVLRFFKEHFVQVLVPLKIRSIIQLLRI